MFTILGLMIIIGWIFFLFAFSVEDSILVFISGCILTLVGIYLMVNGIENLNNWLTQALAVIQIGLGMVCLVSPFEVLTEW
jgi:hypothetical protein